MLPSSSRFRGAHTELFDSLDAALHAYETSGTVETMMREIARRLNRDDRLAGLVGVSTTSVSAFYSRLGQHLDLFLDHYLSTSDERVVSCLLDLWAAQVNLPAYAYSQPRSRNEAPPPKEKVNVAQTAYLAG